MRPPRVYVPHEVLRRNRETQELERGMDLSPAAAFGELVFLLPPGRPSNDPAAYVTTLRAGLAGFLPTDFLLPIGHPAVAAYCAALAARATGGRLRLLIWNARQACYEATPAVTLWPDPPTVQSAKFTDIVYNN
jgi:hypothetical protein